ncbi:TetR/AcrR family transcriptional regulator [Dyadobacter frigoris]|uniref:TetR/AcrR family transcriptional regulator n=1 Tax=Dyadobacter frigoris TaxID=2576211 RepID=A0A4U6CY28_9BACT|nr:TetR/AcrR family transcriptional regulator [Dyadobacter frigoris]TKT88148.1 TetR/AcrR family transcriptional regulator [Dyadobacter frigoris]GLU53764.1 TetR family transcriptional regulator [Dyadobacter frigoris]
MRCIGQSSEEKIKEAARKVFLKKGFDGTTSRDIANEAEMNIALTNYYFRSKEKLFLEIFKDLLNLYFQDTIDIFNKDIPLREKIIESVDHTFEMVKKEPDLVIFIMNEVHKEPERLVPDLNFLRQVKNSKLAQQLSDEIVKGNIRPIGVENILPMLCGYIQFIFMGKNIHMKVFEVTEEQFAVFAEDHKNIIKDMIINYIFLPK